MYTETIETKVITESTLTNMLEDIDASSDLKSILKNTITNIGLPMPIDQFKAILNKLMEKIGG